MQLTPVMDEASHEKEIVPTNVSDVYNVQFLVMLMGASALSTTTNGAGQSM
jgi:hypothetical protein